MKNLRQKVFLKYQLSRDKRDLRQVLDLQAQNLDGRLSVEETRSEGFVTVQHTLESLKNICGSHGHMLAFEQGQLVAYALVMLKAYAHCIPVLEPMFSQINRLTYRGESLLDQPYLVMGQVCIDKAYRGSGVFKELYHQMAQHLSPYFRYIITEVATRNPRSIRAHQKVGFQTIHQFKDATDDWQIILWDWQNKK